MNTRHQLSRVTLREAVEKVAEKLDYRIQQKGLGTMASKHEILGILDEETYEFRKAVHEKQSTSSLIEELKDIAVAALFGIASLEEQGVDW